MICFTFVNVIIDIIIIVCIITINLNWYNFTNKSFVQKPFKPFKFTHNIFPKSQLLYLMVHMLSFNLITSDWYYS